MVKITVVIPTHNRRVDIEKAVRSVLCQTELPNELIVIDDGSHPAVTTDIFNGAPDSVVCKLIRSEIPKGANHARNLGIKKAEGDFVAFLDDDDEFKKDKVKILIGEIEENGSVDIFYHPAEIHMVKENVTYLSRPKAFLPGEDIFRAMLVTNRVGGTPMVTVRKSALIAAGLFDENMPAMQDYELWLRLAKLGYRFKLINTPLTKYHYVTNRNSISKSLAASDAATALIESKYSIYYSNFTYSEAKQYNEWKNKKTIHKSLLNGHILNALRLQVLQFISSPKPKHLLAVIAILIGPKFVYRMKSRFG